MERATERWGLQRGLMHFLVLYLIHSMDITARQSDGDFRECSGADLSAIRSIRDGSGMEGGGGRVPVTIDT